MSDYSRQPGFTPAPKVRMAINIGSLLDIPTGEYVTGTRGESILVGGLAIATGLVGIGNNFKSTIGRYMRDTAMWRICEDSTGSDYDTEDNAQESRCSFLAMSVPDAAGYDPYETGKLILTNSVQHKGNEWYEIHKEFLKNKATKAAKEETRPSPFWNRTHTGPQTVLRPTFTLVDSFTEFKTDDVIKMGDDNELGESGGNTIHMRQGLAKMRFLMEASSLNGAAYNYIVMTAHIGKESAMQNAGPAGQVPIKKLTHLKNGDKIKGVTDKFTFLTHNCWLCSNSKPLMADDRMGPKFPRDSSDKLKLDTDLMEVTLVNLRGKAGASGMPITLLVSQAEGVQPSLTEFYYLQNEGYYGLSGSKQNYSLDLYPECNLSRTTVRAKIDADPKLRRALNIIAEMRQIDTLWHNEEMDELMCSPKQLYEDLKAKGYDWDVLLQTRGWFSLDPVDARALFLSTKDLLKMRAGTYHPYWMAPLPTK